MHSLSCATRAQGGGTRRAKKIAVIVGATLLLAGCSNPRVQGGRKPPKQGPAQNVHLVWKGSYWKVKLNGGGEEDPKTATIKLPYGTGPTMFVVDIQGSSTATFKDSGALQVWENSKSNPQAGSTQILGPTVDKEGKQLIFYDLNVGSPVKLYYSIQLNNSFPTVDPIVDNGGGNWQ